MGKNRESRKFYSQMVAGIISLVALTVGAETVQAASVLNSCSTYCHGTLLRDGARKANPHFGSQSSAFLGNHRNHLPAVPTAASCNICHTPVTSTNYGHQNNVISMAYSLKGYSSATVRAKYDKGVFFNQTSVPNLTNARCSNTNCHFEKQTPLWGSATYVAPAACSACHGAPPAGTTAAPAGGLAGSHARHNLYYPGTNNCQKCHADHSTFTHATSAGRALKVQGYLRNPLNALETGAAYSGSGANYLPSKSASQLFGNCSNLYCHSSGQNPTNGTGTGLIYKPLAWGAPVLSCAGCHVDEATDATGTGSHKIHTLATGANYDCVKCHLGYTKTTVTTATHVNSLIELGAAGFTYSQGSGASHPAANGFGTCSASVCHGAATVTWGSTLWSTTDQCGKCHSSTTAGAVSAGTPFYSTAYPTKVTAVTDAKVGAHTSHMASTDSLSAALTCTDCHGTVTLTGATHMTGTTNFVWSSLATKNGALIPTYTTATRVCANVYCHGAGMPGGDTSGTNRAPIWNVAFLPATITAAGCGTCHGFPPPVASGHPTATIPAGFPATATIGTTCSCHANINTAGNSYANIFVNKALHINGITEVSGGHAVPFYAHATPPFTSCTGCHNASAAGVYPAATAGTAPNCRGCHVAADPTVTTSGCVSCHSAPPNGTARPNVVGSHVKHNAIACATCHSGAGAGSGAAHGPGNKGTNPAIDNIVFTAAQAGASATWAVATKTCSSTYCHGATLTGGTTKSPVWGTVLTGCGLCHGNPPATATHTGVTSTQCINCHTHVNATGTGFTNAALHINGTVEGGDCVSCHSIAQPIAAAGAGALVGGTRRAVSLEFASTWSHKRSAGGAVSKYDCIVCHMEGDMVSGSTTATHKNGLIELRDPDTGLTIKGVTWGGTGAGAYTSSATDMTFNRFSRNLASATIEPAAAAVQINLCLKCHDADGALSASARVPGGSAQKPFATTTAGAAYTGAGVTAGGVLGGVTDIKASFATTNSSYHPVSGKQNNSYTQGTRMVAPWNLAKTNGNNTQWGNLITCWDCHAPLNATGVQTSTVTAHGGAVTLRQPVFGTNPTTGNTGGLCITCHAGYNTNTAANHGAGSAFTSNTDSGMTTYLRGQCHACHSSWSTADGGAPVRPFRAQDAHGFDSLRKTSATDKMWPVGATETFKPYGFIRAGFTTQHKPLSGTGVPTGSATCSGYGGVCSRSSMGSYTPGGVY